MAITALTGTRLRERRLALGLRQADVAQKVGISGSYLNLIEHNRRKVSSDVLTRLAALFDSDARTLGEGAGGRLPEDLRAAAAAGLATPELDRLEDFIGRFPGWATLVASQHARLGALDRAVTALNDRLAHDPRLSHALHEVLSSIASVRATAAILAETGDLQPEWHDRFLANLHGDSERLARGAEALVAHLDEPATAEPALLSPQEEMEAWFAAQGWQPADPVGLSGAAHDLALRWLARMRAEARIPHADLADDPAQVAARHGVGVVSVLRRIALVPGSGAGLVICDGSGTLTFRKPTEGFDLPRFGSACPLWPLYAALASSRPIDAEVEMAGEARRRYRVRAFAESSFPQGFAGPELREAAMLIEPGQGGPALPVGTTCRICPRDPCIARREPSILRDGSDALR